MRYIKPFLISLLIVISGAFFFKGNLNSVQAQIKDNLIIDKIDINQPLIVPTDKILDSIDIKLTPTSTELYKLYTYISDEKATPEQIQIDKTIYNELYNKRTANSQTFVNGNKLIKRSYTGNVFYKDGDQWLKIKSEITTISNFEEQTKASPVSILKDYFLGKALADDYYSIDDNSISYNGGSSWTNALDGTSGDLDAGTDCYLGVYHHETASYLRRYFSTVDTTLPDNAYVWTADYNIYATGNDIGAMTFSAYASNHSNPVVGDDFDTATTTQFSDVISAITNNTYNAFTFNQTGTSTINKTGITKLALRIKNYDVDRTEPPYVYKTLTFQNHNGANPPYLQIAYTIVQTETTTPTSTPSTVLYDESGTNELTMIKAVSYNYASSSTSSPTGYTITYYHIPFFAWIIIAVCGYIFFKYLIRELIIRWRK